MSHGMVTAVMFDTAELDRTVAFWRELLGLETVHQTDSFVYLEPMRPGGPHLAFQLVPETKSVKNRLHLDVRVDDRPALVQRVIELGGAVIGEVEEPGFPPWTMMRDPEGNEFCLYQPVEPEQRSP